VLWTIGHSTRSLDEFLALLRAHAITRLVDVRRVPSSRRHPHFAAAALARALGTAGIEYVHEPDLGGHRKPRPDSVNVYWREEAFRGYADHLATPEFGAALERLVASGATLRTAFLCAEAVPWRCHRQLISDALVARGHAVSHILGPGPAEAHVLRAEARVDAEGRVSYPAADTPQRRLFPR
jgi:uncharacterized protein (DUF488 family)